MLIILLLTTVSHAADAATLNAGDTAWLLTSAALVMLMLPGLALFYGGMVQRKNVLSSLMHSFVALSVVALQWVVIGYSLAFSKGNAVIGDFTDLFLMATQTDSLTGTVPTYAFIMFQAMFA
ncbi:MAG TPA: ammonia channel protein, partial [Syntrophobacteraceae bacterium]|nr:ammonia channel protein [Syntrophobacteraceae bacterium]